MLTALRQAMAEDAVRLRGLMSHMVYADKPDDSSTMFRPNGLPPSGEAREQGVRFEVA